MQRSKESRSCRRRAERERERGGSSSRKQHRPKRTDSSSRRVRFAVPAELAPARLPPRVRAAAAARPTRKWDLLRRGVECEIRERGAATSMTFADVLRRWSRPRDDDDDEFGQFFLDTLRSVGAIHSNIFFECAPVVPARAASTTFRFAILGAPPPLGRGDPSSFRDKFVSVRTTLFDGLSATFPNLSGDTLLVLPMPPPQMVDDMRARRNVDARSAWAYENLRSFTSEGAAVVIGIDAIKSLWKCVADAVSAWVPSTTKLYVSTSGQGVPWLHIRVSTTPKYYRHTPFARS